MLLRVIDTGGVGDAQRDIEKHPTVAWLHYVALHSCDKCSFWSILERLVGK